jgi:hypothetical protein
MSTQELQKSQEEVVINAWLTDAERKALADFEANYLKEPKCCPLGPEPQLGLFTLFISGSSLKEISDLNNQYTLGQIVYAAVEGRWNVKRQEYVDDLLNRARDQLAQTVAESASFLSKAFQVAHKKIGDRMTKFLQTGDELYLKDLDFDFSTVKKYKDGIEMLLKVTGQDRVKSVHVDGNVEHTEVPAALPEPIQVATSIAELAAKKRLGAMPNGS